MKKRFIDFYMDAVTQKQGEGGGGSATLIDKNISANGTYNASSDNADGYKKVVVNVPNSYSAGDEGKVVENGALVSQSNIEYTQNGTYDTTKKKQVKVNVQSGGGNLQPNKVVSDDPDYLGPGVPDPNFSMPLAEIVPDSGYDGMEKVSLDLQCSTDTLRTLMGPLFDVGQGEYGRIIDTAGVIDEVNKNVAHYMDEYDNYVGRQDVQQYVFPVATTVGVHAFEAVTLDYGVNMPLLIDIPNAESIGFGAFQGCTDGGAGFFIHIHQDSVVCSCEYDSFDMATGLTIVVPDSMVTAYENATNWSDFVGNGISIIGESDPLSPWQPV